MSVVLGFDPGGKGNFGWCVAELSTNLPISIRETGNADNAEEALLSSQSVIKDDEAIIAAGLDAPMYWTPSGGRNADNVLRETIKALGAPSPWGTVQSVNSLRGACVVQGIILGTLLRRDYPGILISESHPKVLLWLIGLATKDIDTKHLSLSDLYAHFSLNKQDISEHERDAALAALSGWAMATKQNGWQDLYSIEDRTITPVESVGYWMPQPIDKKN